MMFEVEYPHIDSVERNGVGIFVSPCFSVLTLSRCLPKNEILYYIFGVIFMFLL